MGSQALYVLPNPLSLLATALLPVMEMDGGFYSSRPRVASNTTSSSSPHGLPDRIPIGFSHSGRSLTPRPAHHARPARITGSLEKGLRPLPSSPAPGDDEPALGLPTLPSSTCCSGLSFFTGKDRRSHESRQCHRQLCVLLLILPAPAASG